MADKLPFYLVDAFAERPFRGNPAGVVFDADELSDGQMQWIAREINASETAFISRANDLHRPTRLQWFTPAVEVGFCGHATLAAAHALDESGCLGGMLSRPDAILPFDTAAGELGLQMEELPAPEARKIWWLQMPAPGLTPDKTNPVRTCELLGLPPEALNAEFPPTRTRDDDVIYVVKDWQSLMEMQPRFAELGAWCRKHQIRGICVATLATLSDAVDVQSRFFAPAVGVDEDPVTGSVHGPLAAFLTDCGAVTSVDGRSSLFCLQGRPGDRTGVVRALTQAKPDGYEVSIGGSCFTTLVGEVCVPPRE